jgi:cell division protein FtsN
MSRPTSNNSAAPKKGGSPMLLGILLGMIFGVALAAGLAWYLLKSPSPFVSKEQVVKPLVETIKPDVEVARTKAAPETTAASGVEEAKPRFEFYKVLTDKPDTAADTAPKPSEKPKTAESRPSPKSTYLQAGAFSNAADAENLKAGDEGTRGQRANGDDPRPWRDASCKGRSFPERAGNDRCARHVEIKRA